MTRITNFGRKRTYVEAGFTDSLPEDSKDSRRQTAEDGQHGKNETNESTVVPPPKKKRKRTKPSMRDGNTGVKAAEAAAEREKREAEARLSAQRGDGDIPLSKSSKKKKRERMRGEMLSSERRRQNRIKEKAANTICFACREQGHSAIDCPSAKNSNEGGRATSVVGICYRCGSKKHTLSRCKKPLDPLDPLPFASCFVCNGKGHLASSCPQNKSKGVYPNGGCCKLCGKTSHLAKDCRQQQSSDVEDSAVIDVVAGADEDDFHATGHLKSQQNKEKKKTLGTDSQIGTKTPHVHPGNLPPKKVVYF